MCECYTAPPRQKEVLDNLKYLRYGASYNFDSDINAFPNGLVIRCVGWKGLSSKHCYLSQRINNLHKITIMTIDMSITSFCHGFWIDLFRVYKCKETSIRTAVFVLFEYITQPDFHLGATSKLNRRSTGGSSLFLTIETSRNRREPPGRSTSGCVLKPKQKKQTKNKTNKLKKKKTAFWKLCPIQLPFVVVEQHSYLLIKFTKHQMRFSQCWTHWWAVSYMQLRGILFQQKSLTSITYTCSMTN